MAFCSIDTTVGDKPQKMVNAGDAEAWLKSHFNPDLEKCGLMPECRGCVAGEATLNDESLEGMSFRTKLRRTRVGVLT